MCYGAPRCSSADVLSGTPPRAPPFPASPSDLRRASAAFLAACAAWSGLELACGAEKRRGAAAPVLARARTEGRLGWRGRPLSRGRRMKGRKVVDPLFQVLTVGELEGNVSEASCRGDAGCPDFS